MKISTKGRYALRVMIDLAEHNTGAYVTLKEISMRQEISDKYLESIVSTLVKADVLIGLRGKGGGYKLAQSPEHYTVLQILSIAEGGLSPVSCLDCAPNRCPRAADCKTLPMWTELKQMMDRYLDGISIADLAYGKQSIDNYII